MIVLMITMIKVLKYLVQIQSTVI